VHQAPEGLTLLSYEFEEARGAIARLSEDPRYFSSPTFIVQVRRLLAAVVDRFHRLPVATRAALREAKSFD
jgi:hypothetical protein